MSKIQDNFNNNSILYQILFSLENSGRIPVIQCYFPAKYVCLVIAQNNKHQTVFVVHGENDCTLSLRIGLFQRIYSILNYIVPDLQESYRKKNADPEVSVYNIGVEIRKAATAACSFISN